MTKKNKLKDLQAEVKTTFDAFAEALNKCSEAGGDVQLLMVCSTNGGEDYIAPIFGAATRITEMLADFAAQEEGVAQVLLGAAVMSGIVPVGEED